MAEASKYSLKDYFFQLVTITAGVLIALGVDAIVEWRNHQALVTEARTMIAREIEDNRKELSVELASVEKRHADLSNSFKLANDLLTTKKSDVTQYELRFEPASLDASGWLTAERTGALSFMDYAEVKKYSEVYALQELVTAQQRRVMQSVTAALMFPIVTEDNPHRAAPRDLEVFRANVLSIRAELAAEVLLAQQLLKGYEAALKP